MTVSAAAGPFRYTGNGVTTLFSVPELFYSEDHLQVTVDGVDQVIDVDYTVIGAGEITGGSINFTSAPALNAAIVINHVVGYVQETEFENFDGNPSDVTEKQFDLCVRMAQQNNEKIGRAITIPVEDSNITTELPNAAARAGGVIYFDGSGNVAITTASDTASAAAAAASAGAAATSAAAAATAQAAAEAAAAGLKWRPSVRIASTANRALSGLAAIDGVTPVAGDRVLLKDQTTTSQNGVYIAASGAWTRATDADSWTELVCQVVAVEEGSTNADKIYICTVNAGGTIGSTAITWTSINVTPTIASQAQAEAGVENTTMMTPLRTKQAIKYNNIINTATDSDFDSGTGTIPSDDTIPQNTEGNEFITITHTPKSATNKLIIRAVLYVSSSLQDSITAALFQDSTANALAATRINSGFAGAPSTLVLEHIMDAGTTSATTFKVRVGATAGTTYFNSDNNTGARKMGGVAASRITVQEIGV